VYGCMSSEWGEVPGETSQSSDKRYRYTSHTASEADCAEGKDFDSSTELWDEDDVPKCPGCAIPLEVDSERTQVLTKQLRLQQERVLQLKDEVQQLEAGSLQQAVLEQRCEEREEKCRDKDTEIARLERNIEELDEVIESDKGLLVQLQDKDVTIEDLNKELAKLGTRVADYVEIEGHNNDLQTELFSRDREVLTLRHCQDRLKATYLEIVKNNTLLEEKLVVQDCKHEEEKSKFEKSIVKLTNKLITQRKKNEALEADNAKAVRDCRLAVRLLQCSSPSSNEHTTKQSMKLDFLHEAGNQAISNEDSKKIKLEKANCLRRRKSAEAAAELEEIKPICIHKTHSTSCLESLHCMGTRRVKKTGGQLGGGCTCDPSPPPTPAEQADVETVTVLKELLQGKKDAIHVLRVELGKRDKEIGVLRKKLTHNISQSINSKNMEPADRINNLENRVVFLSEENFNLKYQLEICRKMLDKISDPRNQQ